MEMTIQPVDILPLALAAGAGLAILTQRHLSKIAQPNRIELARRGEALLRREDLPEINRRAVEHMLERAFGFRLELLMMLLVSPIFIAVLATNRQRARAYRKICDASDDTRTQYFEMVDIHHEVTKLNNPILYNALQLEIKAVAKALTFFGANDRVPDKSAINQSDILLAMENSRFWRVAA